MTLLLMGADISVGGPRGPSRDGSAQPVLRRREFCCHKSLDTQEPAMEHHLKVDAASEPVANYCDFHLQPPLTAVLADLKSRTDHRTLHLQ